MKDFISKLKELWKDPKGHAFLILGGYAIFFGMFFLYIFVASKNVEEKPIYLNALQKLNQMNDYDYRLEINDEIITGHILDDNNIFIYKAQEYTYNSDIKPVFEYQEIIKYTDTKIIYNLIEKVEFESKTEYKDGSISKMYKLEELEITTYELNDEIYEVDIILSDNSFKIIYE